MCGAISRGALIADLREAPKICGHIAAVTGSHNAGQSVLKFSCAAL
jgi:hypothetical protein